MTMSAWCRVLAVLAALAIGAVRAGETVDFRGLPLRTGLVVVSDAPAASSVLFSLFAEDFSPFLHSGVLAVEQGAPVVYEAIGKYPVWRAEAPTRVIHGRIARTPLEAFIERQRHVEFYLPPPAADPARIARFAREAHARGVPFDAYFRLDDGERYYCTEFVARALEAGGAAPVRAMRRRDHPSLNVLLDWLEVTDRNLIATGDLIHPDRYLGSITLFASRSMIHAYLAAKREIHRRFTPDQKLGNIFELRDRQLFLRPNVAWFIEQAMTPYAVDETPFPSRRIADAVASLADEFFGLFPEQPRLAGGGRVTQTTIAPAE